MDTMTPQVHVDDAERVMRAAPAPPVTAYGLPAPRRDMTEAERQGMAMGWIGMAFGIFLLLGALALWAAVALGAGFGGWLIGVAVLGLSMLAVAIGVGLLVLRPAR
jgi:hypothetical protein